MKENKTLRQRLKDYLNNLKLNQKMNLLFIFCVIIPMILTDAIILASVYKSISADVENEMKETATSVEYALEKHLEYPANIAHNIYKSRVLEEFLNEYYKTPYDYYDAYYRMESGLVFDASMGIEGARVSIFADNPTILNGSGYYRMSDYENEEWLKELFASEDSRKLKFDYSTGMDSDAKKKRRLLMLVRMDMGQFNGCKKALRLDLDYSNFEDELNSLDIKDKVYVCDNKHLIFSNTENSGEMEPFDPIPGFKKISYKKDINLYGQELSIYIVSDENKVQAFLVRSGGIFFLLMIINIAMLTFMMLILERSFVNRIKHLENSFGIMEDEKLLPIENIGGNDEITALVNSYNDMAGRMNELMNTVYKDRLHEQEIDIARQNAELLALHSQINPHFLFNVLESVRMHSLLKDEKETAEMVGRLAVMERTYVNWGDDEIPIRKEMEFVDAYLNLQKYRFGDRLSYRLTVDDDCAIYSIPKLTIVTFVENACEHGVERKAAQGWIFVRVFKEKDFLRIEVEDTGEGMDEETLNNLMEQIKTVDINSMKEKSHIGILNAFLRLKMVTHGQAEFEMESESGLGTIVRIGIPIGDI